MQDFVYIKNDVLIPLPDAIEILDQANDKEALICNDKNWTTSFLKLEKTSKITINFLKSKLFYSNLC